MEVKYISNCKAVFDFKQMGVFLIYGIMYDLEGGGVIVWISEGGVIGSQRSGYFLLVSIFVEIEKLPWFGTKSMYYLRNT